MLENWIEPKENNGQLYSNEADRGEAGGFKASSRWLSKATPTVPRLSGWQHPGQGCQRTVNRILECPGLKPAEA